MIMQIAGYIAAVWLAVIAVVFGITLPNSLWIAILLGFGGFFGIMFIGAWIDDKHESNDFKRRQKQWEKDQQAFQDELRRDAIHWNRITKSCVN